MKADAPSSPSTSIEPAAVHQAARQIGEHADDWAHGGRVAARHIDDSIDLLPPAVAAALTEHERDSAERATQLHALLTAHWSAMQNTAAGLSETDLENARQMAAADQTAPHGPFAQPPSPSTTPPAPPPSVSTPAETMPARVALVDDNAPHDEAPTDSPPTPAPAAPLASRPAAAPLQRSAEVATSSSAAPADPFIAPPSPFEREAGWLASSSLAPPSPFEPTSPAAQTAPHPRHLTSEPDENSTA